MSAGTDHRFFSLLARHAGSRQRENQLSSTFVACFRESAAFRHAALELVVRACRLKRSTLRASDWTCSDQVPPPKSGGGRVDIQIRPTGVQRTHDLPVFWLESKVEAPLTRDQLAKYRRRGCDYLVAITKRRPEVGSRTMERLGVFAVRWQDLHQLLREEKPRSGTERFLLESFIDFLEDLGMAHRKTVTAGQLTELQKVWNTVRSAKDRTIAVRDGFETAAALRGILDDIRERLIEAHPVLEKFRRWGPALGVSVEWEYSWIGCGLYEKPKGSKHESRYFNLSVRFPHDPGEPVEFCVEGAPRRQSDRYACVTLPRLCRTGTLDEEFLFSRSRGCAKRWGVVA